MIPLCRVIPVSCVSQHRALVGLLREYRAARARPDAEVEAPTAAADDADHTATPSDDREPAPDQADSPEPPPARHPARGEREDPSYPTLKEANAFSSNVRPRPGPVGRTSIPSSMAGVSS